MTIRRIPNGLRTRPEWEKETREEARADLSQNDCCSALGTEMMTHMNAEVNGRFYTRDVLDVYVKCDEYKNEMNLTDAFCGKIQFENIQK